MASIQSIIGSGEQSFRHDPRLRQALARLPREDRAVSQAGPACTSLYWLLRSRRPKLAAMSGRLARADQLVIACALADCGGRLVVDPADADQTRFELAAAGLDWIVRSGACLPCLRRLREYDCLIVGPSHGDLSAWDEQLAPDALTLGLSRRALDVRGLSERILEACLAEEITVLRDGSRYLLMADGGRQ